MLRERAGVPVARPQDERHLARGDELGPQALELGEAHLVLVDAGDDAVVGELARRYGLGVARGEHDRRDAVGLVEAADPGVGEDVSTQKHRLQALGDVALRRDEAGGIEHGNPFRHRCAATGPRRRAKRMHDATGVCGLGGRTVAFKRALVSRGRNAATQTLNLASTLTFIVRFMVWNRNAS